MTTSDLSVIAFVAALGAWCVSPRRRPKIEQYVFPTPLGSKRGLRVPGVTFTEIAENVARSELFAGQPY